MLAASAWVQLGEVQMSTSVLVSASGICMIYSVFVLRSRFLFVTTVEEEKAITITCGIIDNLLSPFVKSSFFVSFVGRFDYSEETEVFICLGSPVP
jgi:hypothetical protein